MVGGASVANWLRAANEAAVSSNSDTVAGPHPLDVFFFGDPSFFTPAHSPGKARLRRITPLNRVGGELPVVRRRRLNERATATVNPDPSPYVDERQSGTRTHPTFKSAVLWHNLGASLEPPPLIDHAAIGV